MLHREPIAMNTIALVAFRHGMHWFHTLLFIQRPDERVRKWGAFEFFGISKLISKCKYQRLLYHADGETRQISVQHIYFYHLQVQEE